MNALLLCRIAIALAFAFALTGCVGGGGTPTRYYIIDPIDVDTVAPTGQPRTVEILDLALPQYLERFNVTTRAGSDRLHFSDSHQWGENLRKNLLRTLSRNLSRLLGTSDVGTPLARTAAIPDQRLRVTLEEFERGTDGTVRLAASWQVIDVKGASPVRSFSSQLASERPVPPKDYDGIVAQMRHLFGELSREIAAALEQDSTAEQDG